MKFTIAKNIVAQAILSTTQVVVQKSDITERAETWAAIGITALQAFLAIAAHYKRPNGQPIYPPAPAPAVSPALYPEK